MNEAVLAVPGHVPRDRVRDVDLYNLPGADIDPQAAWQRVQRDSPAVYFTPRYGGYWVIASAELLERVWGDHETFSSADGAIAIPRIPDFPPQLPIEADPPLHHYYRAPVNFALSPRAVQQLSDRARALMISVIETVKPRGECDFVADVAGQVPMDVFLSIVNLPGDDRDWLITRTQVMTRSADAAARNRALGEVFGYIGKWLDERTLRPGNDLLSKILQIKVGERPITRDEALAESAQILFGGLDTVAGTMSYIARHMAEHPEHRRQLIDNPALIPQAIEELLRRYSIPTVGRRVTRDVTLDGVTLKAGDYVQLTTIFHAVDDRMWPQALDVQIGRRTAEHLLSFGKGVHRCPGSNLARAELRMFLEEWLPRIPEFSVKPGSKSVTATGAVAGMLSLPLVWPLQ